MISAVLIRLFGWRVTLLYGDPCVVDRWDWLQRHLRGGAVRTLDAGCGSGAFTLGAAKLGNQALGLSFDDSNNVKATHRAKLVGCGNAAFLTMDLRQLDNHVGQLGLFDQVISTENIEHIVDDAKLIRDLAKVVKLGGELFLTTPYQGSRGLWGDRVPGTPPVEDGGHVRWGYSHDQLRRLLGENGFAVTSEDFVSGYVSQCLTNLIRRMSSTLPYSLVWQLTLPMRIIRCLDRPITRLLHYPYLSVAVVATRTNVLMPIDRAAVPTP
jgi:SAM-dependent methyltransferase